MNVMTPHLSHSMAIPLAPVPRITIDAYCQTQVVAKIVKETLNDPVLTRAKGSLLDGDVRSAIDFYAGNGTGTPSVIILEVGDQDAGFLGSLDELARHCAVTTNVIVIGHLDSVRLNRALMDRNVRDYLVVGDFDQLDLVRAISRIYAGGTGVEHGHVTAVLGTVGGAGASTIACNLAYSLATLVPRAVLVDLDFAYGTAAFNFDQDPKQDISEALFTPERIDGNLLERLILTCDDNLAILPAPARLEKPWDVKEEAVSRIIETLRRDNSNLILDLPRVWTQWSSLALQVSNEVVIVMTPTIVSLRNAQEIVAALEKLGKKPRLILNQVGASKQTDVTTEAIVKGLSGLQPTAILPYDRPLHADASANARMLAQIQPKGGAAQTIKDLARMIVGIAPAEPSVADEATKSGVAGLVTRLSQALPRKSRAK